MHIERPYAHGITSRTHNKTQQPRFRQMKPFNIKLPVDIRKL